MFFFIWNSKISLQMTKFPGHQVPKLPCFFPAVSEWTLVNNNNNNKKPSMQLSLFIKKLIWPIEVDEKAKNETSSILANRA